MAAVAHRSCQDDAGRARLRRCTLALEDSAVMAKRPRSEEEGDDVKEEKEEEEDAETQAEKVARIYEEEAAAMGYIDPPDEIWQDHIMVWADEATARNLGTATRRFARLNAKLAPTTEKGVLARQTRFAYLNKVVFGKHTPLHAFIRVVGEYVDEMLASDDNPALAAVKRLLAETYTDEWTLQISAADKAYTDALPLVMKRFRKYYFHSTMYAMAKWHAHAYTRLAMASEFHEVALPARWLDGGSIGNDAMEWRSSPQIEPAVNMRGHGNLFVRRNAGIPADAPNFSSETTADVLGQTHYRYSRVADTFVCATVERDGRIFSLKLGDPSVTPVALALSGLFASTSTCLNEPARPITTTFTWRGWMEAGHQAVNGRIFVSQHRRLANDVYELQEVQLDILDHPINDLSSNPILRHRFRAQNLNALERDIRLAGLNTDLDAADPGLADVSNVAIIGMQPRLHNIDNVMYSRRFTIVATYRALSARASMYSVTQSAWIDAPNRFFVFSNAFNLLRLPAPATGVFSRNKQINARINSLFTQSMQSFFNIPTDPVMQQVLQAHQSPTLIRLAPDTRDDKSRAAMLSLEPYMSSFIDVLDHVLLPVEYMKQWKTSATVRERLRLAEIMRELFRVFSPGVAQPGDEDKIIVPPPIFIHYTCAHCPDAASHVRADGSAAFCARHLPSQ